VLDHTDHTASILVIAAWIERDELRARVTSSAAGAGRTSRVVTSAEDAVELVRDWVERVAAGPLGPPA
jgi:hypothetical protein